MEFIIVKKSAFFELILLVGISLLEVLGFALSINLSIYLLNAIAELRANTIHRITKSKSKHLKENPSC
jgi:hypothetical protein